MDLKKALTAASLTGIKPFPGFHGDIGPDGKTNISEKPQTTIKGENQ
jgi:hypothetical protein